MTDAGATGRQAAAVAVASAGGASSVPAAPAAAAAVAGPAEHPGLRVAVRVTGRRVPAYVAQAIAELARVDGVEIVLVGIDAAAGHARRPIRERAYEAVERRLLRGGPDAGALVSLPVSVAALVEDAQGPGDGGLPGLIARARPHVLLDLGLPVPPLGSSPPLERWTLRFGAGADGPAESGTPRGAAPDGLGWASLVALGPAGDARELERSIGQLAGVGFVRTRDALCWASANFAARAARRRLAGVPQTRGDIASTRCAEPAPAPGWPRVGPSWRGLAGGLARRLADRILYRRTWAVVYRRSPDAAPPSDLSGFEEVTAPPGRFYADPFVLEDGGAMRLFVEESRSGRHEGAITVLTLGPDGRWMSPRSVLAMDRHLAYPHVIRLGGRLVMTPDDGHGASVRWYRPSSDAAAWQPGGELIAVGRASDPTLLEHEGRLWLFLAVATLGMAPWQELHLYSAPGLEGPWRAHPQNPVVADARRARPAGRVLRVGTRLVRPAQDCGAVYGRRVILNEISRLTTEDYAEQPVATIEPTGLPGIERTHCYTVAGDLQVADAFLRRRRVRWPGVGGGKQTGR